MMFNVSALSVCLCSKKHNINSIHDYIIFSFDVGRQINKQINVMLHE